MYLIRMVDFKGYGGILLRTKKLKCTYNLKKVNYVLKSTTREMRTALKYETNIIIYSWIKRDHQILR
jgi:hypothetical protein